MAPGDLRRDELIKLVEALTRADGATEEEDDRLLRLFQDSVIHPAASDLIFYSHKYFGEEYRGCPARRGTWRWRSCDQ